MKTKIIYISGNETFEMSEIRAAFEEVRNTLGLDRDTILFGVPVDADNALAQTANAEPSQNHTETPVITPEEIVPETETDTQEPVIEEETLTVEPTIENNVISVSADEIVEQKAVYQEEEPVIPILSVLGGATQQESHEPVIELVAKEETESNVPDPQADTITEVDVEESTEAPAVETLKISIEDVVTDQVPVEEKEKTLEELLESMEPLGEDVIPNIQSEHVEESDVGIDEDFSVSMTDDMTDTDATLAQLANEFAQTQDQIPNAPKTSGGGKISKLKNILPFKKAKRDDNGLMGDLFGWAGIAANDEDFSIPGFFTSAGGQK